MPVNIHGKSYKTVAERLDEAHTASDLLGVETAVLYLEPQIMVKATIVTKKGTFTGISAADPNKAIEAKTPVEVAETSAVGRALSFAGYAGSEIASADEMIKAGVSPEREQKDNLTAKCKVHNVPMIQKWSEAKQKNYWFHKSDDGLMCFGKGYLERK